MINHISANSWIAAWLLANLLFIGIYDLVAGITVGGRATISAVIWLWSQQYPPVVIIVGIILGHLFWPQVVRDAVVSPGK